MNSRYLNLEFIFTLICNLFSIEINGILWYDNTVKNEFKEGKMKKKLCVLIAIILIIVIIIGIVFLIPKEQKENINNENFKIITSFYPIYIMTVNITQDAENIEVANLTQNDIGCLHDYTLSTADMRKLENADILIQNGLGIEEFMDKIIDTYPKLKIIDSSEQATNKIKEDHGINSHIWTSLDNYIKQVEWICQKLSEYNSENKEVYLANTQKYVKSLKDLKAQYETDLQHLNGAKAICLNEALVYLAKDINMEVTSITTNHEESTLSADTIKNVIQKMKQENIKIILIGSEDNKKNAETLAQETGAKICQLETGLTGNISKESYLNSVAGNLEILKQIGK